MRAPSPGNVFFLTTNRWYSLSPRCRPSIALRPNPLYSASGQSQLAQFFGHLDATYGGTEGYMKQKLGFTDAQLARLREVMLD
jgi:protein-tyrosine phosphatase